MPLATFLSSRATPILSVVGGLFLLHKFVSVSLFAYRTFVAGGSLLSRYGRAGHWAVVTGGSEGIGFAMANELAARGFSVAVIALEEPLLFRAVATLRERYPSCAFEAIPFDFYTATEEDYVNLHRQLDRLPPVSILVNNVGIFYKYPKPLEEATMEEDLRLLRVNIEPQVRMTKYFLPRWRQLRCGGIVNLSSFAAVAPAPLMSVYAGTKGFNYSFAMSLAAELEPDNIDVLIVTPCIVSTRITQFYEERPIPPGQYGAVDANEMARHSLDKLGVSLHTAGHHQHDVAEALYTCVQGLGTKVFRVLVQQKYIEASGKEREIKLAQGR